MRVGIDAAACGVGFYGLGDAGVVAYLSTVDKVSDWTGDVKFIWSWVCWCNGWVHRKFCCRTNRTRQGSPHRHLTNNRHVYKCNIRLKIASTLVPWMPTPKSYPDRGPTVLTYFSINLTVSGVSTKASSPPSSSAPPSLSGGPPTNSIPVSSNLTPLSPFPA